MSEKIRLDQLLVERGLAPSRTKAQAIILAGQVYSGEKRLDKPGQSYNLDLSLTVRDNTCPWVSRGGLKLIHALDQFNIDPTGWICLDIGASTGGFTDVLLQKGAKKIYAVDVGWGQLDWCLRQAPRVIVLEKTNARYLTHDLIPDPIDIVVCDASFISLKTVLPASMKLAEQKGQATLIALIKPQFEVGKGSVGKGGVVRDPEYHRAVCDDIKQWLEAHPGWSVIDIIPSPILGPKGNKEFLIYVAWKKKASQ